MGKKLRIFVAAIMSLAFIVVVVAAVFIPEKPDEPSFSGSIPVEGTLTDSSGSVGDWVELKFGAKYQINTVEIEEATKTVTAFEIYSAEGDKLYASDYIDRYKFCSFPATETAGLRLKVTAAEGDFEIKSMKASMVVRTADPSFDVVAYVTADSACKMGVEWKENAKTVTQFNLIGALYFDCTGRLVFDGYDEPGLEDGHEVFERALANLRKLNPNAEIVATVLGNRDLTGDGYVEPEDRYNAVMGDETLRGVLVNEILDLADNYGLDGVSFDYEYPYMIPSFTNYYFFLNELSQAIDDSKLLSIAVSVWNMGPFSISSTILDLLDGVELMSYDSFDKRGNHSTFLDAYDNINNAVIRGATAERMNLGLPYYSRPVTGATFWGNYKDVADKLGYGDNMITETFTDSNGVTDTAPNYYNGRQTIYDKTCYAIDRGLGGVMIWHFACDSTDPELSLTAAIQRAIDSRS